MSRNNRGATLSLAAVSMIVIIIIGIGMFLLSRLLGGNSELMNAVDSGSLELASQTIVKQSVNPQTINSLSTNNAQYGPYILAADEGLFDTTYGNGSSTQGVSDLLTYNRLVAQALLVALNAEADGGATAIANAQTCVQLLQAPQNSIGQLLQQQLSPGNWMQQPFLSNSIAQLNSLRMMNNPQGLVWQSGSVGYVGQNPTDDDAANIQISGGSLPSTNLDNLMPFSNYQTGSQVAWPSNGTDISGNYMSGYQPIQVPLGQNTQLTIYGVAISPTSQAHLVSRDTFHGSMTQPGAGSVAIPPNAFGNVAFAGTQQGNYQGVITAESDARVGAAAFSSATYPLSIPNGYLVIDNSGTGTVNAGAVYSGVLPVLDNVTAQELLSGISALALPSGGSLFSNNGALEAWIAYNQSGSRGPMPSSSLTAGLFDQTGSQATTQEAEQAAGPITTCNDFDSDGPNANALCNQLLANPVAITPLGNKVGAFDFAYYGANASYGLASSAPDLTADEYAAVALAGGYAQGATNQQALVTNLLQGGPAATGIDAQPTQFDLNSFTLNLPTSPPVTTGMRAFNNDNNPMLGASLPYYPGNGSDGLGSTNGYITNLDTQSGWLSDVLVGGQWIQLPYLTNGNSVDQNAISYSNPYYFGVVTQPGSILDLVQQNTTGVSGATGSVFDTSTPASSGVSYTRNGVQAGVAASGQTPADEIKRFITNRLYQIKPTATTTEINTVLNTPLALGSIYYAYVNSSTGNIVMSTTPPPVPPGVSSGNVPSTNGSYVPADGTPVSFSTTFDLINPSESPYGTMVNPMFYDGTANGLFNAVTSSNPIVGTHTITYTPGTGAYNNLGVIKFTDVVGNGLTASDGTTGSGSSGGNAPVFSERN